MPGFSNDKVKQTYFLLSITILACVLAYLLLRKYYFRLTEQRKWNKNLAVLSLMVGSMFVMVLPVALLSVMLSSKASYMVHHYADFIQILKSWNNQLQPYIGVDLLSDTTIQKVTAAGANVIPGFLSATVSSVTQLAVMYFLLYFLLIEGRRVEQTVLSYSPFHADNTHLLIGELKTQTMSNAIGIPILVVAQGLCAGIGYWIFGMDQPFFWAVITGFAAVIPLVGTGLIWVPVSVYLYFTGAHWQGIGVLIFSALILTNVDNAVRFIVLKRLGNTHPLITFFGIVIGLDLFGFLGLIFGPLMISYFLILLEIYQREYLTEPAPPEEEEIVSAD
jgi:predicted PurR-regulated permease PerM